MDALILRPETNVQVAESARVPALIANEGSGDIPTQISVGAPLSLRVATTFARKHTLSYRHFWGADK